MWFLGAGSLFLLGMTFLAAVCHLPAARRARFPAELVFLGLLVLVYAMSLLLAIPSRDPSRVLASAFNLAVWICLVFTLSIVHLHIHRPGVYQKILRDIRLSAIASAVIGFAGLIVWRPDSGDVHMPTLLGIATGGLLDNAPGLIADLAKPQVIRSDYLLPNFALPRPSGLHLYPNAFALAVYLGLICHFLLAVDARGKAGYTPSRPLSVFLMAALAFSMSRVVIFAAAGLLAIRRLARRPAFAGVSLMLVAAAVVYMGVGAWENFSASIGLADLRADSTDTRFLLYKETLAASLQSPLIGIGVKPRTDAYGVAASLPLGSHSTILGTYLKTGLVGLLLLIGFLVIVGIDAGRAFLSNDIRTGLLASATLVVLAWMLVEDVDAPILASMQAFLIVAVFRYAPWREV
jgi:hypothetical protein